MQEIIESYLIDGKLYVTTKFVSEFFQTDARNIRNWKKEGLKSKKERGIRQDLFLFNEVYDWNKQNINPSKSRAGSKTKSVEIPHSDGSDIEETVIDIQGKIAQANELLQLKGTSQEDADRIKKILDGLIQAVKLGEQTKELIPKRDIEKVLVEFVVTLIQGYKRDIKLLPDEMEGRTKVQRKEILESTYRTNINKFQKIANSELLSESKLYDVIEVVVELIQDEVTTDAILKWIKEGRDKDE